LPPATASPQNPTRISAFPHATQRWAKKIRGKLHYFGPWHDWQGALRKYQEQKEDLHAGRTPRVQGDGLTVRDLLNCFLTAKKLLVDSGELAARTFADYKVVTDRLSASFGLTRLVDDLAADDFERLRAETAKTLGPVALGNAGRIARPRNTNYRQSLDSLGTSSRQHPRSKYSTLSVCSSR
jgi:hypothetical protein